MARLRLADRHRDHRGRLPAPGRRPHGHHRSPLERRRRRSRTQATSRPRQRRLRHLLAIPPRPRTEASPPISLRQRRHPARRVVTPTEPHPFDSLRNCRGFWIAGLIGTGAHEVAGDEIRGIRVIAPNQKLSRGARLHRWLEGFTWNGSVEGPEMGVLILGSRIRRCLPDLRRAIGRLGPVPPVVQIAFRTAGYPEPDAALLTERERP